MWCKGDQIKMRDYMNMRVTPPKRVTSPTCTWGPPYPCKQALMHPLWGWSPNTSPQKRLLVWIQVSHISVNDKLLQMSHSKGSCCRNDTKFVLQLVTRISLHGWWKAKMGWDSKNQWANHAEWFCLSPWLRSLILPYSTQHKQPWNVYIISNRFSQ